MLGRSGRETGCPEGQSPADTAGRLRGARGREPGLAPLRAVAAGHARVARPGCPEGQSPADTAGRLRGARGREPGLAALRAVAAGEQRGLLGRALGSTAEAVDRPAAGDAVAGDTATAAALRDRA